MELQSKSSIQSKMKLMFSSDVKGLCPINTIQKKAVALLLLTQLIFLATNCTGTRCPCTEQSIDLISQAYSFSLPLFGDDQKMTALIYDNVEQFAEGGDAIQCLNKLADAYLQNAFQSYSSEDYDYAYGRVLEMGGTGEMAQQAATNLSSGAVDSYAMGQELKWLAEVLPSAAAGNWNQFNSTGTPTRNQIREAIPLLRVIFQGDEETLYRSLQMGRETMNAYLPQVKYEIQTVATILCK